MEQAELAKVHRCTECARQGPDIRQPKVLEKLVTSNATPQEIEQAGAMHTALVAQKQALYLTGVGLNQAQIPANINNPPGTPENRHLFTGDVKSIQQQFDTYVKPDAL